MNHRRMSSSHLGRELFRCSAAVRAQSRSSFFISTGDMKGGGGVVSLGTRQPEPALLGHVTVSVELDGRDVHHLAVISVDNGSPVWGL